jgi:Trk-type K+ transport systems, membrane components
MTGISTGGYSTKNASIAYWNSAYVDYVMMFCMCIGGMKLMLLFFLFKGLFKSLREDEETKWFFAYLLISIIITVGWLFYKGMETGTGDIENTIRKGMFQVISLVTTTGYLTADFTTWGEFYWLIAIFLMLICGCGGSTSGGLKMGRAMILIKNMFNEFHKQIHPSTILPVRVTKSHTARHYSQDSHFHARVFSAYRNSWLFLLINGLDFEEALGTAVTAISNVRPSLGSLGDGNLHDISSISKWYVSFLMMAGRLEIFTVITILLPGFWKR